MDRNPGSFKKYSKPLRKIRILLDFKLPVTIFKIVVSTIFY